MCKQSRGRNKYRCWIKSLFLNVRDHSCVRHISCLRLTLGLKPVHVTKDPTTRIRWCNWEQELYSNLASCTHSWYELGKLFFSLDITLIFNIIHTQHLGQCLACHKHLAQVSSMHTHRTKKSSSLQFCI